MENRIDIADRLCAVTDELKGLSNILFFIYEKELQDGSEDTANAVITLSKMVGRYCKELNEICEEI